MANQPYNARTWVKFTQAIYFYRYLFVMRMPQSWRHCSCLKYYALEFGCGLRLFTVVIVNITFICSLWVNFTQYALWYLLKNPDAGRAVGRSPVWLDPSAFDSFFAIKEGLCGSLLFKIQQCRY
jgi:hypothetical protein